MCLLKADSGLSILMKYNLTLDLNKWTIQVLTLYDERYWKWQHDERFLLGYIIFILDLRHFSLTTEECRPRSLCHWTTPWKQLYQAWPTSGHKLYSNLLKRTNLWINFLTLIRAFPFLYQQIHSCFKIY